MIYDVIVIGVGGMGSAALYHLARRNASVLGLEQFDIPHELGSSHGVSRIIRLAYSEGSHYVPLLRRSYELWRELQDLAGEPLLIITGGIDAGTKDSETVTGVLESCAIHQLQHEVLNHRSLNERFPGYHLAEDMVGVFQPESGFLLPERCIVAHVQAAQKLGAEVHGRERVVSWEVANGTVSVATEKRTYRARKLVVTAGPWTASLLPALEPVAIPQRQVLLWTQPLRHPEHFALSAFPIFNLEATEGRFYGFPVYSVPGFKIGKYYHRRHTNTPDTHFILDQHPAYPQVAIAAGFSGHGFKFCSVVGEIMAQLALDGATPHDLRPYALDRPSLRSRVSNKAWSQGSGATVK